MDIRRDDCRAPLLHQCRQSAGRRNRDRDRDRRVIVMDAEDPVAKQILGN